MPKTTPTGLWLHGIGLTTPLGDRPAAVAAAVRAGLSGRCESEQHNRRGDPMIVAQVPDDALPPLAAGLAARPPRHRRLLRLATSALQQSVAGFVDVPELPLLLTLPESHPRIRHFDPGPLLADLRAQTGVPLAASLSSLDYRGRAGGLAALADAHTRLRDPRVPWVLVGGLDSYLDAELLSALDSDHRVHAAGIRDGFAPGEGAAFLLLARHPRLLDSQARVHIAAPGLGHEYGHRYSDAAPLGDGLADALRHALGALPPAAIHTIYAGLNGEHDGAREWGVAALRNRRPFADDLRLDHPADCLGDPGAAMAPTLLALLAAGLERGYCAPKALVWCASDGPQRGAVVVDHHPFPGAS